MHAAMNVRILMHDKCILIDIVLIQVSLLQSSDIARASMTESKY